MSPGHVRRHPSNCTLPVELWSVSVVWKFEQLRSSGRFLDRATILFILSISLASRFKASSVRETDSSLGYRSALHSLGFLAAGSPFDVLCPVCSLIVWQRRDIWLRLAVRLSFKVQPVFDSLTTLISELRPSKEQVGETAGTPRVVRRALEVPSKQSLRSVDLSVCLALSVQPSRLNSSPHYIIRPGL